jgi:hypothetical protein
VRLQELLRNPLTVLLLLPFLPLVVLLSILGGDDTWNEEVWEVYEDRETGALKVVVHRHVRRG